ncbi:MAG: hypothetical protein MJZ86_10140 [Bacteroidales bacterium]|nr:hypothetical protein [Bacteroidales bacterium]
MFTTFINQLGPWVSIITGVISLFTFMYVTVGGIIFKKKVVLHSLGPEQVTFRIQLRNYNVQQITNVVSARFFDGGTVPPHVRQEIIGITAPTAMKEFRKNKAKSQPSIFVNLSNHPAEKWSDNQIFEAKKYGPIIDIAFPSIDSLCSEYQIEKLADEYEKNILQKTAKRTPVVHIMGEMNFTYALVKRLRRRGIVCVASTTERLVEEHDGQKTSTFKFVKFRRYE